MAVFYTGTHRKRLFETKTEEALRRRGTEMLGLALIVMAGLFALALASYSPDDPSLFASSTSSPQNMLGSLGAIVADLLLRSVGWASWGLPLAFVVWGARLVLHRGEERVVTRIIMVPLAVALGAVFASAHVPPIGWGQDAGLGGWFGDAMLGGLLTALPISVTLQLKLFTLLLGIGFLLLSAFALGVNVREAKIFGNFLAAGVAHLIDLSIALARKLGVATVSGAKLAGQSAKRANEMRLERKARREDDVAQEALEPQYASVAKAPLVNRVAPPMREPLGESIKPVDEKRLMSRISEAIRAQSDAPAPVEAAANEEAVEIAPQPVSPPAEQVSALDLNAAVEEPEAYTPLGGAHRDDSPLAAALNRRDAESADPAPLVKPRTVKPVGKSKRAKAEEQPTLALEDNSNDFELPPLGLLSSPREIVRQNLSNEALESNARMLEAVLDDYGVKGEIVSVRPGPVVTMYELEPAPGLKASRVIGLADDIARSMSALAARVSTVPGRTIIGIELPNETREMVLLREILSASAYGDTNMRLPLALGKDIGGEPIVENLAKMPHLLIAGTTGSGKSVAINTMILSLLYTLTPDECRMIMIDPKMLELSVYDGIPHLLSPVVTDPKKAVVALKWVVAEMEERYRKMSKMGVRNIEGYNSRVADALAAGEAFSRTIQTGFDDGTGEPVFETEEITPEKMAYIVVVVDEMADLMMVAGKEIEACIQRLAQMARASGIHLIMATQRPSVDVITGTIKANFPTRISFQVTSKVDSRTILGEMGAEQLLGQGDMLHMAGGGRITRVHGPFVSDEEVEEIVNHLKAFGEPTYVSEVVEGPDDETTSDVDLVLGLGGNTTGEDALYDQAVAIVARDRKCSTSYIQRKLAIGYNKAARLVEQMEDEGVVSQANHVGKREVLVPERANH